MKDELHQELGKLQSLFKSVNKPFPVIPGATLQDIENVYKATGIRLSGHIVDLYEFMNGSNREEIFAVFSDEETPCEFLSIAAALDIWGMPLSDSDTHYQKINRAYDGYKQQPPRDLRIQANVWANKRWFPFAEFNGGGTTVYWDDDPAPTGDKGQIIVYQHDPDAIYFVASDFLTFMRKSNELFTNNPRELLEGIYD